MTRILIGALSGLGYRGRRDNCRASWLADVKRFDNLSAVFLLGVGEDVKRPVYIDDVLALPCPDHYDTLPQRTNWFCRWALARDDWDYLFKCDDDTYVCVERLAAYQPAGDYVGTEWQAGVNYGSGGAGYFLSRRAAEIVAEHLHDVPGPEANSSQGAFPNQFGSEDLIVGDVLRRYGINLVKDNRFVPFKDNGEPCRGNAIVTAHQIPNDFYGVLQDDVGAGWPLKIVMPTCDKYAKKVLPPVVQLLDRFWPRRPEIDVVHYEEAPPEMAGVRRVPCGESSTAWTEGMKLYLAENNADELVLLMLDDYAICAPVKVDRVRAAVREMLAEPSIAVTYLTWHQTPILCNNGVVCHQAPWAYTVNTQAAIWRRSALQLVLHACGPTNIETFELAGSQWANAQNGTFGSACRVPVADPPERSDCLDETCKEDWAVPYHNLMRRGGLDGRHRDWCRSVGVRF